MRYREFFDFVTSSGRNTFREWLLGLPVEHRSDIQALIRALERERNPGPKDLKRLHGDCDGLWELRLKRSNIQYRPLCFQGPGPNQFTLLAGATERDRKFSPPGVCKTALNRRSQVIADQTGRICAHQEDV